MTSRSKPVVLPPKADPETYAVGKEAYTGPGTIYNSDFLNGLETRPAIDAAIAKLEALGLGEGATTYRLRDWGVSRQRYWGCPIPVIKCEKCGTNAVPDDQLPVSACPTTSRFDVPGNPLERHPTWKHTRLPEMRRQGAARDRHAGHICGQLLVLCPVCGASALKAPVDKAAADYWLPVDQYVGGVEHAVLHLALFHASLPAPCATAALLATGKRASRSAALFTQGMVTHETYKSASDQWLSPEDIEPRDAGYVEISTGAPVTVGSIEKMSKSKRNTVDPEEIIADFGADVARWFVLSDSVRRSAMSNGPSPVWKGPGASHRRSGPVSTVCQNRRSDGDRSSCRTWMKPEMSCARPPTGRLMPSAKAIEGFRFNSAVATIHEWANALRKAENAPATAALTAARVEAVSFLARALTPFMPHLAEECWERVGGRRHGQLRQLA